MFRATFLLSINTIVFSQLNNCLPKRFLCEKRSRQTPTSLPVSSVRAFFHKLLQHCDGRTRQGWASLQLLSQAGLVNLIGLSIWSEGVEGDFCVGGQLNLGGGLKGVVKIRNEKRWVRRMVRMELMLHHAPPPSLRERSGGVAGISQSAISSIWPMSKDVAESSRPPSSCSVGL